VGAACSAGPADDVEEVAAAAEAVKLPVCDDEMVHGPCGVACRMLAAGGCPGWEDECADSYPADENVSCNGKQLACEAARYAMQGTRVGLVMCWRSCEHLRN